MRRRQGAQRRHGGERVGGRARGRLRSGQAQAVLGVVREEAPERAIDVERARPVLLCVVQLALHRQPLFASQARRRVEGALGRRLGARVVAERRPGRGEAHLNHGAGRLACRGLLEPVARGHGVERAQALQPFGVEPGGVHALGERRADRPRRIGRVVVHAQALPERAPGGGHERKQIGLGAGLDHRVGLAVAAEHLDVEPHLT